MIPLVAALLFPVIAVDNGDPVCAQFRICRASVPIHFRVHDPEPYGGGDLFVWTFSDGTTSNEREPVHTFTEPDWQNASLLITNETGWTQASVWVNANAEPYDQWGLVVTPWETTIAPGETVTITAAKRSPNFAVFDISCHGAIECDRATIGMNENETRVIVRAVSEGVGGLFYTAVMIGGVRTGGPFAGVHVRRPVARSRAVRK